MSMLKRLCSPTILSVMAYFYRLSATVLVVKSRHVAGESSDLFVERGSSFYKVCTTLLASVLHFYLLVYWLLCLQTVDFVFEHCSWNISFFPTWEQNFELLSDSLSSTFIFCLERLSLLECKCSFAMWILCLDRRHFKSTCLIWHHNLLGKAGFCCITLFPLVKPHTRLPELLSFSVVLWCLVGCRVSTLILHF